MPKMARTCRPTGDCGSTPPHTMNHPKNRPIHCMPQCGAPWNFTRLFAKITKCDRLPLKFCMRFLLPALPFPSRLVVCVAFATTSFPGFTPPPHHHHIASFWPFFALFACPSVRSSASLTCYACKSLWQIHRPWATTTNRQMGVTCKIFLHKNVCPPTRIG